MQTIAWAVKMENKNDERGLRFEYLNGLSEDVYPSEVAMVISEESFIVLIYKNGLHRSFSSTQYNLDMTYILRRIIGEKDS